MIDIQLKETYPEDEVKAFYDNFKGNFAQYQGENSEVVETLLEFVDF